ncbi:hypothetical protein [Staphylococcus phage vB_SsapH-Golestan-100]|nr:hypothetical protein [Staphylococcus phage vB_SsapH-Golestan-100]
MKNVLLTIIAVALIGALGFGVFAYFDTRDNVKELSSNKVSQQNKKGESSTEQSTPKGDDNQQSSEQNNTTEENTTPEMVDVLNMIDEGKDVNGIVDQEGNTWTMNPGKAVSYVNPKGEEYIASLNYTGEIDGIDFKLSNEGVEGDNSQGELYPDSKVVDKLQSEIDNAGLQSEMEAKQRELDDYLESFE